jgi:hypothetical protein
MGDYLGGVYRSPVPAPRSPHLGPRISVRAPRSPHLGLDG